MSEAPPVRASVEPPPVRASVGPPPLRTSVGPPPLRTWVGPVTAAVAKRPWLWTTAVRQVFVLAANGWWRHRPWLPLPDAAYMGFRMVTQYGDSGHAPEADDVVTYLRWCRSYRAATRTR